MRRKRGRTARDRAWGYISTHATCHVTGRGCHANALPRDNPHPLRRTRTTERTARAVCVQPMPKKKDWGEATRRSDRLTTSIEPAEPTQSEEPAEPAERITKTEADQDDHAIESSDKMCCRVSHPSNLTTSSLSWPKARRKVAKRHEKSPQPRALSGETISRRSASPPTELTSLRRPPTCAQIRVHRNGQ